MMKVKPLLIGFILLLWQSYLHSQQISFNKVLPPEGKSFEHVTDITQDKQGFLWLATKRGIFRYDGFRMESYKNNPLDSNSLASDEVETIATDSSGILWIGTVNKGLDRFDPQTGTFTHFRSSVKHPENLSADNVTTLSVTSDGLLWMGTGSGLSRYDSKTNTFKHYRNTTGDSTSISCNEIVNIYEDKNKVLWIATGSVYGAAKGDRNVGGLNKLDRKTETFTRYKHDPRNPNSLISNKVRAMFEDSKGNFWIGTSLDGLHVMNRTNGTFHRHLNNPKRPEKLSRPVINEFFSEYDHITFINEDASGKIWIGTSESGLNIYNPSTKLTSHYELENNSPESFTDRTTWTAYNSNDGVMWLTTLVGTVYRIKPDKWQVTFIQNKFGGVNNFWEDTDGTFWIGTWKGGLLQIKGDSEIVRQFAHNPEDSGSIISNVVDAIYTDHAGRLWVGTSRGLELMNRETGTFKHFFVNRKDTSNFLTSSIISAIQEDSRRDMWIGTFRGANRIDHKTGRIQHFIFYPNDTNYFGPNVISTIIEDAHGFVWIGSPLGGGLHRVDPGNGQVKKYLSINGVVQIFKTKKDELWLGGNNLFKYDREADSFYLFTDISLISEVTNVKSITGDDDGKLWVGIPDGILEIDIENNKSMLFGKNFKVDGNTLNYGAIFRSSDGRLWLGCNNGYYVFHPEQLIKSIQPPQVVFSDFRLGNRLVKTDKNGVLPLPLSQLKTIRLNHDQNVFSLDFAAIDFTNPDDNTHMFMLENYDVEWRQSGDENRAYYFNVPPGEYVFRVKGANGYGVWAEKSVNIIISPPWWKTWWAYSLFAIIFATLIWAFIHYRSRQLQKENKLLEEKVAQRTTQLEHSLTELKSAQNQLIQAEKMASLGELTAGIAHEIQNPLNFVNNFSDVNKDLTIELEDELGKGNINDVKTIAKTIRENEEKINHHGKRADAIVKNMLQHSRSAVGVKEPTDINALADEYLRMAYHGLRAKDKSFNANLITNFDETIGKVNIIPQDIGRVLLNLYNNAFYATTKRQRERQSEKQNESERQSGKQSESGELEQKFEPKVIVTTRKEGDHVIITVEDNGNGIPDTVIDKIFQPFFTTKSPGEGTGLGLSLSYDIVKAHGGEIKVKNKSDGGAVFIVSLPVS